MLQERLLIVHHFNSSLIFQFIYSPLENELVAPNVHVNATYLYEQCFLIKSIFIPVIMIETGYTVVSYYVGYLNKSGIIQPINSYKWQTLTSRKREWHKNENEEIINYLLWILWKL